MPENGCGVQRTVEYFAPEHVNQHKRIQDLYLENMVEQHAGSFVESIIDLANARVVQKSFVSNPKISGFNLAHYVSCIADPVSQRTTTLKKFNIPEFPEIRLGFLARIWPRKNNLSQMQFTFNSGWLNDSTLFSSDWENVLLDYDQMTPVLSGKGPVSFWPGLSNLDLHTRYDARTVIVSSIIHLAQVLFDRPLRCVPDHTPMEFSSHQLRDWLFAADFKKRLILCPTVVDFQLNRAIAEPSGMPAER
ncbi:hypothetical protein DFH06DRAFT_1149390 [Mycena polygramma]|nr:hypothetical protein DFH06DRAFT_1149390 [Mycena polygramma]